MYSQGLPCAGVLRNPRQLLSHLLSSAQLRTLWHRQSGPEASGCLKLLLELQWRLCKSYTDCSSATVDTQYSVAWLHCLLLIAAAVVVVVFLT